MTRSNSKWFGPMSTGKRWTVSFAKVLLSIRRSSVIPRPRFANCSHRPCEVHPAPLAWVGLGDRLQQGERMIRTAASVLAALIQAPASAAAADNLAGQASVIDGDTLEIPGTRIRLWDIDAPESSQLCRGDDSLQYRCGAKAANDLDAFIARRSLNCIPISLDQYGRTVATCSIGDVDLREWLVLRRTPNRRTDLSQSHAGDPDDCRGA